MRKIILVMGTIYMVFQFSGCAAIGAGLRAATAQGTYFNPIHVAVSQD